MDNPYEVLGIPTTATLDEVKSAYRRVAKETHPDLHGGSPEHAVRFRAATEAYAVLADPDQRRRYDASGSVDEAYVSATREEVYAAVAYVQSLAAQARGAARASALRGLAWLAGGLLITVIGYAAAASSGGGGYVIMYGAIIFGGWQALRGLAAYVRIGAQAAEIEREIWSTITDLGVGLPLGRAR